jgi:hypothetical protein
MILISKLPVGVAETVLALRSLFPKLISLLADSILMEPAYVLPLFMISGVVLSGELTAETIIVDIYIMTTLDPV